MSVPRDVLFANGRFVDPSASAQPIASALLARDGKIVALGAEAQLAAIAAAGAERIDLGGRTALPGWVEAHAHVKSLGQQAEQCDLSGTANRQEALERLSAHAAANPRAAWLEGRGFNLNAWADTSYPTAIELDAAIPDRPCVVRSFDGHAAWLNSEALKAAVVGKDAPFGGRQVVRDSQGRATGVLLEKATDLASAAMPEPTSDDLDRFVRAGVEELVSSGLTAVHWLNLGGETDPLATLERLNRLWPGNSCPLRVRVFAPFDLLDPALEAARAARADDRVQMAGIKCFYDGALGVRTAWMFEPYIGDGANRGIRVTEPDELMRRVKVANAAGLPVVCHAIGDRACHEVLEAFSQVGDPAVGNRVEHAQMIRREDIRLFRRGGVAASVQPSHLFTDWRAANALLGPRRVKNCLSLRSLLDAGVVVAMGSDAPVVPCDPRHSLHAAITRTDRAGQPAGGWLPGEAITPQQWARCVSWGAWRSLREEAARGTLAAGMDCDLTVVREDPLAPGADYLNLHVDAAVVAGEVTLSHMTAPSPVVKSR
jgi:hypothetical protein